MLYNRIIMEESGGGIPTYFSASCLLSLGDIYRS